MQKIERRIGKVCSAGSQEHFASGERRRSGKIKLSDTVTALSTCASRLLRLSGISVLVLLVRSS